MLSSAVGATALAADTVGVPGSDQRYPATVERQVNGKPVKLRLTGTAVRQKFVFNVYAVASYLQDGVKATTAGELIAAEGVKQLHLVFEREVAGNDMSEAISSSIRMNYPERQFRAEMAKLAGMLQNMSLHRGDEVFLTYIPGTGLKCQIGPKNEVLIESPAFGKAVWEIYLGRRNIGEPIKAGLVSRL